MWIIIKSQNYELSFLLILVQRSSETLLTVQLRTVQQRYPVTLFSNVVWSVANQRAGDLLITSSLEGNLNAGPGDSLEPRNVEIWISNCLLAY